MSQVLNLPSKNFKIKVGPFTYNVEYDDKVPDAKYAYGVANSSDQIIALATDLSPERLEETFLHELIHIIHITAGLHKRFGTENPPGSEEVAHLTAIFFYQFMQNNSNLFKK